MDKIDKSEYKEIWVFTPDGQSMCALINGDQGFLMYLRYEGDAGFTSRNLDYHGTQDAVLEYFLHNGQRDEYPLSWALPISDINRALDFFEKNNKPPVFIKWRNDAGDGLDL